MTFEILLQLIRIVMCCIVTEVQLKGVVSIPNPNGRRMNQQPQCNP